MIKKDYKSLQKINNRSISMCISKSNSIQILPVIATEATICSITQTIKFLQNP